jgi:hypothetical protein
LHVGPTNDPTAAMHVQVNATGLTLGWKKFTQAQGACRAINGSCMGTLAENHGWKNTCALALLLAKSGRSNLPPFGHRSHRFGDERVSPVNVWWNAARVQQGRIRVGGHGMQGVRD